MATRIVCMYGTTQTAVLTAKYVDTVNPPVLVEMIRPDRFLIVRASSSGEGSFSAAT